MGHAESEIRQKIIVDNSVRVMDTYLVRLLTVARCWESVAGFFEEL
jgi:hypothetical protein